MSLGTSLESREALELSGLPSDRWKNGFEHNKLVIFKLKLQ